MAKSKTKTSEENLAKNAKDFKAEMDAKAKAVKALTKAVAEQQRAEVELAKVQNDVNIQRVKTAAQNVSAIKEELLSLKLSAAQIDNLYKLYSEKMPQIQSKTASFAGAINSMAQSLEKQALSLSPYIGLIPQFREKIEELANTKKVMADVGGSVMSMLSTSTTRMGTYSSTIDAENTRGQKTIAYQNEIVKLQTQLSKLAQDSANNAKLIGTEKFKEVDTTELLSKIHQQIYDLNSDSSQLMKGAYGDLKAQLTETLSIADALTEAVSNQRELSDILQNDVIHAEKRLEAENDLAKLEEQRIQLALKRQEIEEKNYLRELRYNSMIAEYVQKQAEKRIKAENSAYLKILKFNSKIAEELQKQAERKLKDEEKAYLKMLKFNSKIEEDKAKAAEKARVKEEREVQKHRQKLMNGLNSFIGRMPLGGILSMIASLGPMFALIAAIIGAILWLVTRWDKHITDIQKNLGITKDEATAGALEMAKFAKELGFANVYTTEIKKSIEELTSGLGIGLIGPFSRANAFAKELVAATTVLTDKFGMTGDEVANLTDMSTAMNTSLSSTTILVEKMAKGSFNIRSVFQTLAKLTPSILTAFRGSNAQLVAMALNAKRLGVEMGDIIQSSMSLLDVEDAISKAFEAQVVTGQNIDIDQLMYLKLTGQEDKLLQLQEQTLKSANYLNMKSPVSQQLIAESIGLSPDQASQIALRSIMTNQLGLTPDAIREMQKRGESVMDMLDEARKAGKITEKERELLGTQAQQYDALSIQEKLVRALDNAGLAISSSMKDLGNSISLLIDEISKLVQALGSLVANMPGYASAGMGILGGLALGAGGLFLLKKGKGLFSAGKAAAGAASGLGAGLGSQAAAVSAASSNAGASTGFMKGLFKPQTFGKALKSGGIGTLVGTGIEIAMGRDPGDAIISGLASGAGAVLGGLVGGPAGAFIGGMALGGLADYLLEDSSADAAQQQLQAAQERNAQLKEMASRVGYQAATPEYSPMSTVEQKIDTTNALLQQLLQKQTDVTIELDNEKVGKAVLGYSAESFDRNRQLGNTFGNIVDSTANRKRG